MPLGAYVIKPREDDPPLFDWFERSTADKIPPEQEEFAFLTRGFIQNVIKYSNLKDDQNHYIEQAQQLFRLGCVQENPNPRQALRELKNVEAEFIKTKLEPRIRSAHSRQAIAAIILLFVAAAVAVSFRNTYLQNTLYTQFGQFSAITFSNYALVWCASMAAIFVPYVNFASINTFDDFQIRQNQLHLPVAGVIAIGFISLAVSMGLNLGAITASIGDVSTSTIDSQPLVALFIGFLSGLAASSLGQSIIAKLRSAIVE